MQCPGFLPFWHQIISITYSPSFEEKQAAAPLLRFSLARPSVLVLSHVKISALPCPSVHENTADEMNSAAA